ncbi:hypothetical protein O6H91_11G081200 [Diphasiastrum complanatum]|uniref:Uncharacterized protein n=1 Tax=Diphasiastrum complanatum TaxID=34168 RepID=A0ACC2CBE9_DIPCM|nr:hypothetical protein O6H91_11G081200 [Diphasiastrum complanatum]
MQDQPPVPTSYAEWAAAFQAYYNGATPPPGYFPPAVAPGQPHPYMWAGQPVMPPYGAAPPFAAMYPPGHPYGHPSMPQGPHPYPFAMTSPGGAAEGITVTATTDQGDSKSSDGKERSPLKRSKEGSPKRRANKGQDGNKSTPTSANGVLSQRLYIPDSAESGSDGSSDGSEEDNREDMLEKRSYEESLEGGSIGNAVGQAANTVTTQTVMLSSTVTGRPAGLAPTTNLNVGLDYWSAAPPGAATVGKGKRNPAVTQALVPSYPTNPLLGVAGREGATSDFWLQDERELKRQRRKQSNRESARRSRLRKQAECEELATRVDTLTVENLALRSEISRLVEERNKLSAENSALLVLRKDCDDGTNGVKMLEMKEDSQATCSTQDNGKVRDAFDAEAFRTQGLRHSREESGKSVEHVSTGLDIGGRAAAVTAS